MKLFNPGMVVPVSLVLCSAAFAQTVPSAGSLNQQLEKERPLDVPNKVSGLRIEQAAAPSLPVSGGQKVAVRQLQIVGAQLYAPARLLELTAFRSGSELGLSELRAMAAAIATFYRDNGYFLAQAYLPAQDIKDGVVTIAVLEGRYGRLDVRNSAVPEPLARDMLAGLGSGDPVAIAPLETRLLMLSDLPGVNVKSTLVPGASVGASDLIIELAPAAPVSGYIDADNQGNRYTGVYRLGTAVQVNNPTGSGDLISVRALTSAANMDYGRLAYQRWLGRATAGVAFSRMHYRLGEEFASLQASGVASIASVYGSYRLLRSRAHNLSVQLHYDDKRFEDRSAAAAARSDKTAQVAMLSLNGDSRDGFAGVTTYTASWINGALAIEGAAALAADAASVRTDGRYHKLAVAATRVQQLADAFLLQATVSGQRSSKNLDVSEKMGLGGNGGVRAYPSGESFGDQGYVINLEAHALLPTWGTGVPGRFTVIGFVDHGSVTLNKHAWSSGSNHRSLSGAGVGVNWAAPDKLVISATIASKLGNDVATSAPDQRTRFWFQGVKYF